MPRPSARGAPPTSAPSPSSGRGPGGGSSPPLIPSHTGRGLAMVLRSKPRSWDGEKLAISNDRIEHDEELSHTGGEGELFRLSGGDESLVEDAYDWVVPACPEGSHVEGGPHPRAPVPARP